MTKAWILSTTYNVMNALIEGRKVRNMNWPRREFVQFIDNQVWTKMMWP